MVLITLPEINWNYVSKNKRNSSSKYKRSTKPEDWLTPKNETMSARVYKETNELMKTLKLNKKDIRSRMEQQELLKDVLKNRQKQKKNPCKQEN